MALDPDRLPEEYRRALETGLGKAPGRMICRADPACPSLRVWDVWDMRPARRREGRPRLLAEGLADEEEARRIAYDLRAAPLTFGGVPRLLAGRAILGPGGDPA
jgi:hypothetical protein